MYTAIPTSSVSNETVPLATTTGKITSCECCVSPACCNAYNRIGIFMFVLWLMLQIVSVCTPWDTYYLTRTGTGGTETVNLQFFPAQVFITHTFVTNNQLVSTSSSLKCSYSSAANSSSNILYSPVGKDCPNLASLGQIFPTVIGTSVASMLGQLLMILWLYYRTTETGRKALFEKKCFTQTISVFLTIVLITTTTIPYALYADQGSRAILMDIGTNFFTNYGCSAFSNSYYAYINCYYNYYYCPDNYQCASSNGPGSGFIISIVIMSCLVVCCFYTWIGSWCCPCCCCVEDEEGVKTLTTTSVHYPTYQAVPINPMNTIYTLAPSQTYTIFVHHGQPFPTKMVINANSLPEFEAAIGTNLGLSVPFRIAVFDDLSKQYVLVSHLSLVPAQATIQVIFN